MKFQGANRFNISDEVLSQEVNGETVLLDLEGESYFSLNEVGTRVWQLLKSESSVGEVLAALGEEYDVSHEQLEKDVEALFSQLAEAGLIELQSD